MFGMKVAVEHGDLHEAELPQLPALFAQKLAEDGYFAGVEYSGYKITSVSTDVISSLATAQAPADGEADAAADTPAAEEQTSVEETPVVQTQEVQTSIVEFDIYVALNSGDAQLEDPIDETADADSAETGEEGNE
jgi:hypothetical protein